MMDDYNHILLLYKAPKRYRSFSSSDYRNDVKVGSNYCLFLACFDSCCLHLFNTREREIFILKTSYSAFL